MITGSISSLIVILTRIAGIQLNDWVRRILGIILLISLPVMVFTSIRMYIKAKNG